MSRTYKDSPNNKQRRDRDGKGRKRNISVRSIRRDPPDYRKLSWAVITLAMAQADAEAQAAADKQAGGTATEPDPSEPTDDR